VRGCGGTEGTGFSTPSAPEQNKLLIVYGDYSGALPSSVLKHIPPDLADTAEFIFHRLPVNTYPLPAAMRTNAERYEQALVERYKREATLVLTPLHHVATPCLASGIPVVIARSQRDDRFSFLETFVPIYTVKHFAEIDWNPKLPDLSAIRSELMRITREKLR
jgi:hypothetical protein